MQHAYCSVMYILTPLLCDTYCVLSWTMIGVKIELSCVEWDVKHIKNFVQTPHVVMEALSSSNWQHCFVVVYVTAVCTEEVSPSGESQ